ncbi:MAG TPA: peroxiredoxin [Burkholderiales bacterium]|nr:peroxiredoxin [Burkholderiales bacterium]
MSRSDNLYELPKDLPVPENDGGCNHLTGMRMPQVLLQSTDGTQVDMSALPSRTIVYCYPRTGRPDEESPTGWNQIPGARGCTPQACGFRDHYEELRAFGIDAVYGLSAQSPADQREAVERLHLPFALLSDEKLEFAQALRLPTFDVAGMTLIKRLTLIVTHRRIQQVFYPVFPPDASAAQVIHWLVERTTAGH